MRVPLEILRLILSYFDDSHEDFQAHTRNQRKWASGDDYKKWLADWRVKYVLLRKRWLADSDAKLALRLVSPLFDAEILAAATFPDELPVKPSTWYRTPPRIREKYMLHCIKHQAERVRINSYALPPVLERQLARLNISPDDSESRENKTREWCNLTGYHVWNLGWVPCNSQIFRAPMTWQQMDGWVWMHSRYYGETEEISRRKGVEAFDHTEQDDRFLRIMCMIADGNTDALEKEGYLAADVINLACGHTFLGIAIEKGSLQMVQLILRETKVVRRSHLYIYLRLALNRDEAQTFVNALLDALSGTDKKRFAIDLFDKAISNSDMPLFDTIVSWMTTLEHWEGSQKLEVIEWCFKRVHDVMERRKRRHANYNSVRKSGVSAWLEPLQPAAFLAYPAPQSVYTADLDAVGFKLVTNGECSPQHRRAILEATSQGLQHWIGWMLWAGADPPHLL